MTDMLTTMMKLQAQALDAQRQQLALVQRWAATGKEVVAAQRHGAVTLEASAKAWSSWLGLWGIKG